MVYYIGWLFVLSTCFLAGAGAVAIMREKCSVKFNESNYALVIMIVHALIMAWLLNFVFWPGLEALASTP